MVLGKLPVPGRPTIWMIVGQGPTVLAVGAGGCCLDISTLVYPFSPLSPFLWEMARYTLKYCLKLSQKAVKPKTSNQPREIEQRNDRRVKKCPNNPTRTYCKDRRFLSYYYPTSPERPSTEILRSTIAPPAHASFLSGKPVLKPNE